MIFEVIIASVVIIIVVLVIVFNVLLNDKINSSDSNINKIKSNITDI